MDYVEHSGPILITLDKISNAFFQALQTTSKNYNSIKANVVELTMNHLKISVYNLCNLPPAVQAVCKTRDAHTEYYFYVNFLCYA